jgi:hypothetical protein
MLCDRQFTRLIGVCSRLDDISIAERGTQKISAGHNVRW